MTAIAEALLSRPSVRMSIPMKLMYVLLKNPDPTPVEFAQLFAEISLLDRASDLPSSRPVRRLTGATARPSPLTA